jgi:hypothetical protein
VSRQLRILLAVSFAGVLFLAVVLFPELFLRGIVLPVATALWLVLRTFVLSIHQEVLWWGVIVLAVLVMTLITARGRHARVGASPAGSAVTWDPTRRWRSLILLYVDSEPSRDLLRRDLAWLLSSLYVSSHPGGARYQVREDLEERRIEVPPGVYDFLFAALASRPRTLRMPVSRRRRTADYLGSVEQVVELLETRLEMTHERDPRA